MQTSKSGPDSPWQRFAFWSALVIAKNLKLYTQFLSKNDTKLKLKYIYLRNYNKTVLNTYYTLIICCNK